MCGFVFGRDGRSKPEGGLLSLLGVLLMSRVFFLGPASLL